MQNYLEKAHILIEALPYIRSFFGKYAVIKYGGAAMNQDPELHKNIVKDIALMKFCGINPIIIHGGGKEISAMSEKLGIKNDFIDGFRITDTDTMQIAQMVLLGKINRDIVTYLCQQGVNAIGISGQDCQLITVDKYLHKNNNGKTIDLGFVGEIKHIKTKIIHKLIMNGFVPVIAPIGSNSKGESFNINADSVAGAIAGAIQAEKLIFMTDVPGILAEKNNHESLISQINIEQAKQLLGSNILTDGMIPKIQACINAIENGTHSVHIIDGRVAHSLLLEIFTDSGIGTVVTL